MKSRTESLSIPRSRSVVSSRYAVRLSDVIGKMPSTSMEWREYVFILLDSFENDITLLFENAEQFLMLIEKSSMFPLTGIEKAMGNCFSLLLRVREAARSPASQHSQFFPTGASGGLSLHGPMGPFGSRSEGMRGVGSVDETPVKSSIPTRSPVMMDLSANFESTHDLMTDVMRLTQALEDCQKRCEHYQSKYLSEKARARALESEMTHLREESQKLSTPVPDVVGGDDIVLLNQLMSERDRLVEENKSLVEQLKKVDSPLYEPLLMLYEENFMLQRFLFYEQDAHKITQVECRRLREEMATLQKQLTGHRPA